jgi:hypothetical protein
MGPRLRGDDTDGVANASPPVLFAAPGKPTSFFVSLDTSRVWRAKRRSSLSCESTLLPRCPRLSARHGGVFRQPGRAFCGWIDFFQPSDLDPLRSIGPFRAERQPIWLLTVSQLLTGGLCVPGRSPGTARAR